MQLITAEGQLKIGDKIEIIGKSEKDSQKAIVREIINQDGNEEVIINKRRNFYFITKMVVSGESWAKSVSII